MTALRKNKRGQHERDRPRGRRRLSSTCRARCICRDDTLLVADLHFEKGSSFARRGRCCRPTTPARRWRALAMRSRFGPRAVIALGDSFHDIGGPDRLGGRNAAALTQAQAGRDWIWVTGNHDRALPEASAATVVEEMDAAARDLRHEPAGGRGGEIAGPSAPGRQGGDAAGAACAAAASSPTARAA